MNGSSGERVWSERGSATVEFAFTSVMFIFLAFGIVEYGMVFSEQHAVTALAREGASLASRNLTTNGNMLAMLTSTEGTLELNGNPQKYAIFLAQINGSLGPGLPPVCTVTAVGTLTGAGIAAPTPGGQCNLPNNLWNRLQWQGAPINAVGVNQFTVVQVNYQHTPLTPVGGLSATLGGNAHGNTAHILQSQAIF